VHISAIEEGDNWLFSIQDNGNGIDKIDLDELFVIPEQPKEGRQKKVLGLRSVRRSWNITGAGYGWNLKKERVQHSTSLYRKSDF